MLEKAAKLWVIHMSRMEATARKAQEEGFVAIGWQGLEDLSKFPSREAMKDRYRRLNPDKTPAQINSSYSQAWRFAHEIEVGDAVVYPIKGAGQILIGEVSGSYRWMPDDRVLKEDRAPNVVPVKWLKRVPTHVFSVDAFNSFSSYSSVSRSDDYLEEVIAVLGGSSEAAAPERKLATTAEADPEPSSSVGAAAVERAKEETKIRLLQGWAGTAQEFEGVVAAVFRAMGYTVRQQQGTHDLGVDVIAHRDPLGVDPPLLKIQCKSGAGNVGSKDVKALRGTLNSGEKGVMVSLGSFSNDANHVAQNDADMILIDSQRFVDLFLEFYDKLDAATRHRFPLQRVYVAVG
jgi:restriction system protein